MPDDVAQVLGRIAAGLPGGGETRPGQVEMARAVELAISDRRHLLVQAGTGTGKSLAYLVPSVMAGEPVVVATATKALQDQLAEKDLPAIASVLDGFTWAVLKGRSNYLCRQRATEAAVPEGVLDLGDLGDTGGPEPGRVGRRGASGSTGAGGVRDQVQRLLSWAETSTTGDRAELDFEPHPRAWAAVSVGARECPGAFRCPSGGNCFAEQARARAAVADVVVVNTHLYAAHVASGGAVLPPHRIVIFDEAHEVEDIMTAGLGTEIGPRRFANLVATARPLLGVAAADGPGRTTAGSGDDRRLQGVAELAEAFNRALHPLRGRRITGGALDGGGREQGERRGGPAGTPDDRVPDGLELHGPEPRWPAAGQLPGRTDRDPDQDTGSPSLAALITLASGRLTELIGALDRRAREGGDDDPDRRTRHDRVRLAAGNLADDVARLLAAGDNEVVWVDGDVGTPVLRISPVEVGPALADRLWDGVTGVLTSATLPVGLPGRLGLPGETTDGPLDVGSPFDYRSNALLYVPRHLPDRRAPEAEAAIHDELEVLIRAAGGRTLALFTSRRAMTEAAAVLGSRLPYPVLSQADLPKPALVAAFRSEEQACLFATLGFFQGVDVPGKTLSLVTIDRIPFPRPDTPVLQARRERAGSGAFRTIDLPRAGTLLAQGAGRLIRSAGDRGVVAVLDSRLATAGYRDVLLASVPPMRRVTDRKVVVAFLQEHVTNPSRP